MSKPKKLSAKEVDRMNRLLKDFDSIIKTLDNGDIPIPSLGVRTRLEMMIDLFEDEFLVAHELKEKVIAEPTDAEVDEQFFKDCGI